ncbi:hypothetical protein VX037_17760, partial [Gordonia sp. Z-3]|uniref:hypothetical protein n=1 Tax=Gordonia sp. Z-3 TaxID=3115408 RepID=UPI002E2B1EA4
PSTRLNHGKPSHLRVTGEAGPIARYGLAWRLDLLDQRDVGTYSTSIKGAQSTGNGAQSTR